MMNTTHGRMAMVIGAGTIAAGTAAIIHGTARRRGTYGATLVATTPLTVPIKKQGNMKPPT
jgi:hypothetical protein